MKESCPRTLAADGTIGAAGIAIGAAGPTAKRVANAEQLLVGARPSVAVLRAADTAPYGLGKYASRSTPVAGGALAMAARKVREKAKKIAAHMLEASADDIEWENYKFTVVGVPGKSVTMKEVAFAAYTNPLPGSEPGLEATFSYDPPNMTFPHGAYIAVVDVDVETGFVKVRRFLAIDDCGTIVNPMIVEGQIHGGLTEGFAIAFMQEIRFDAAGNNLNTNFTEYLVPTSLEMAHWETDKTVTPSPHHPIGVKHIEMPLTRAKVWHAIKAARAAGVPSSTNGAGRQ